MLQALLEERFQLKVYREAVERPVYELTVEKGGVKMQLSKEGSCTPYSIDSPPPLPAPNAPGPLYCDFSRLTGDGLNWTLDGAGVRIEKLATTLSRSGLDRPLIDRIGLAGGFDLHLKWTADVPENAARSGTIADPTGLSIFTALKEQLGLKLESAKGPDADLVRYWRPSIWLTRQSITRGRYATAIPRAQPLHAEGPATGAPARQRYWPGPLVALVGTGQNSRR
jgi:uncharacterized protein (TIGR03435 family)